MGAYLKKCLYPLLLCVILLGCKSSQLLESSINKEQELEQEKVTKVDVSNISSLLKVLTIDKDRWLNVKLYSPVDSFTNLSHLVAEANYYNKDKINLKDSLVQNKLSSQESKETQKEEVKLTKQDYQEMKKNNKSVLEQISYFLWALVGIGVIILLVILKIKKWF